MKTIKLIKQDGNRSVGIFKDNQDVIFAMTYTQSKEFKTERGAANWLKKRGYA